jgi:hypothetical protein
MGSPYRYSVYLTKQADGWRESMPTSSEWETGKIKAPKDFAMPLWFSGLPLSVLMVYAMNDIVSYVIADQDEGMNHDYNFEAMWPALVELMRVDEPGGGAVASVNRN